LKEARRAKTTHKALVKSRVLFSPLSPSYDSRDGRPRARERARRAHLDPGTAGMGEFAAAVRALAGPDGPAPLDFGRDFQASTVHRPVPSAFMDSAVAASRRLPVRVRRALLDGMLATEPPAGLAALRAPTLLLWGERDAIFPRAEQDALLRLIPGARLAVYPGTGHAPHRERPAEFARDLARFAAGGVAAR
jgi:non-heme chloroperoxidase